jgi:hypothetical protein
MVAHLEGALSSESAVNFSQEILTAFPRLINPIILAGVGTLIFVAHILRRLAKSQRQSVAL